MSAAGNSFVRKAGGATALLTLVAVMALLWRAAGDAAPQKGGRPPAPGLGSKTNQSAQHSPWAPFTPPKDLTAAKQAMIDELWGRVDAYWHLMDQDHGYPLGRLDKQVDGPKYGEIRGLLEAITVLDPQDMQAWTDAAWLLWYWNNDEATRVYTNGAKALKDPRDRSRLYWEWASFCLSQTFDTPGALDKLQRSDVLAPPSMPTKHLIAELLVELGRYSEAREVWKQCLKLWPNDAAAKRKLALSDQELKKSGDARRQLRAKRAREAKEGTDRPPAPQPRPRPRLPDPNAQTISTPIR